MTSLLDLPPERKGWKTRKYEAVFRERIGISAALIAEEFGLLESTVCMIQRKLGLRKCRPVYEKAG